MRLGIVVVCFRRDAAAITQDSGCTCGGGRGRELFGKTIMRGVLASCRIAWVTIEIKGTVIACGTLEAGSTCQQTMTHPW